MQIDHSSAARVFALADFAHAEQCPTMGAQEGPILSVAQSVYPDATQLELRTGLRITCMAGSLCSW